MTRPNWAPIILNDNDTRIILCRYLKLQQAKWTPMYMWLANEQGTYGGILSRNKHLGTAAEIDMSKAKSQHVVKDKGKSCVLLADML